MPFQPSYPQIATGWLENSYVSSVGTLWLTILARPNRDGGIGKLY